VVGHHGVRRRWVPLGIGLGCEAAPSPTCRSPEPAAAEVPVDEAPAAPAVEEAAPAPPASEEAAPEAPAQEAPAAEGVGRPWAAGGGRPGLGCGDGVGWLPRAGAVWLCHIT
jgi:hypothetical protein